MQISKIGKFVYRVVFLFPLLSGCVMNDIATKEEVNQVQGSLSEEVIGLKRSVNQLQLDLDETLRQSKNFERSVTSNEEATAGRMRSFERRLVELDGKLSSFQSELSRFEGSFQKNLNALEKGAERSRQADLAKMEQKLNIILEEVSRENERILQEVQQLKRASLSETRSFRDSKGYHTVQPGESLSRISARYSISTQALSAANAITDPNSIRVGQKLKIPKR